MSLAQLICLPVSACTIAADGTRVLSIKSFWRDQ